MPDETDVTPVAGLFDAHDVPAFLKAQPAWWRHGIHGFRPELDDPEALTFWTFSRPAKAAFESWQRATGRTT